jgi:predicted dehydrogenase
MTPARPATAARRRPFRPPTGFDTTMKLTILDPGHFHAALVQKNMIAGIDAAVDVFAPAGPDLDDYQRKIASFNARSEAPTRWELQAHAGPDYLERFVADESDGVVVLAGNNRRKIDYIARAVGAGMHTLADKPMVIDTAGFDALVHAFATAREHDVLLYDIMTERFEITTILQKEFAAIAPVFGGLVRGSSEQPAVTKESVHYFSKQVAGAPLRRPPWFFDTAQQGEGLVDITTHLVDLVQWECFPGEVLDYRHDIRIDAARRWPTPMTLAEFTAVTGIAAYPDYLAKDVQPDGRLHVYANGQIDYAVKGVHAKVSVLWDFVAPPGGGDTHYSVMRGTRSNLVIRQGAEQGYRPALTIEPVVAGDETAFAAALERALPTIADKHPGIGLARRERGWEVTVPDAYHVGHEAHFGQVTAKFLDYIENGGLPAWEVPNMLAKYYTTTHALDLARS